MGEENTSKSTLAKLEEKVLSFWKEHDIFNKSIAKDSPKGEFVFYDGPPFATGLPHYGHILAGTIKDAIPRYQTMRGYSVRRRWGWDCHGLPLENEIEKELGLKTKRDIEELGVEEFNAAAKNAVLRYADDWKKIVPRLGRWVDMENDYKTMDTSYTESVWWVFKSLHDKGLVYKGFKSMHLCPRCGTTLSNFEVSQNYQDIKDLAVTVKLELVDEPKTYLLVWTTTPWTLPGNMAAAINKNETYVKARIVDSRDINKFSGGNQRGQYGDNVIEQYWVILAKPVLLRNQQVRDGVYEFGNYDLKIEEEFSGKDLVGRSYIPPFDYYSKKEFKDKENAWKIYHAEYVSMESGTGAVHLAPAFGEEDMDLAREKHIPIIHHVTPDGVFDDAVVDFAGMTVKPKDTKEEPEKHMSADIEIIKALSAKNLLFKKEKITHSYPLCWRCDTPLLNYASSSWFVRVSDFSKKLVAENKKIQWVPQAIGEKRFGNWLENARDWSVSRSRYWGAPLPVWVNDDTGEVVVIGSLQELKARATTEIDVATINLHRPFIDEVLLHGKNGTLLKRIPDVFDCWFESGSMPYGQNHYPFEHTDIFEPKSSLFQKSRGYPAHFIAEGLDQTRGWFYSLIVLGTALFGKAPYKNVIVNGLVLAEDGQKMSKRLKNYPDPMEVVDKYGADALRFYLLSSSIVRGEDLRFSESGVDEVSKKISNRLLNVLSFYQLYAQELSHTEVVSESKLDHWVLSRLNETIQSSTDGYEGYELDKATRPIADFIDDLSTWYIRRSRDRFKKSDTKDAQQALATTRFVLLELSKVLAPVMPFLAEHIYKEVGGEKESVHLDVWPKAGVVNTALLRDMENVRRTVTVALEARSHAGVKVRQPLASVTLVSRELEGKEELLELLKDEVNVHDVFFDEQADALALDTVLTPELEDEGVYRELVRAIQSLRKEKQLHPSDSATLVIKGDAWAEEFIRKNQDTLMLATGLSAVEFSYTDGTDVVLNGHTVTIMLG